MALRDLRFLRAAPVALLVSLFGCDEAVGLGFEPPVDCPRQGSSLESTKAHLGEHELDVVFTRASNYSCEIPAAAHWQVTFEAREDDERVERCRVKQFPAWMHVTDLEIDQSESLAVLLGESVVYIPDEAYHEGGIVPRLSSQFGFAGSGALRVHSSELSSIPTCCRDPELGTFDPIAVLEEGPFELQVSDGERVLSEDSLALSFDVNWGSAAACAFIGGEAGEIEVELFRGERLWGSTTGMMTVDEQGARWSLDGTLVEEFVSADGTIAGVGDSLELDVFVPLDAEQADDVVACGSMELKLEDGSSVTLQLAHGRCEQL